VDIEGAHLTAIAQASGERAVDVVVVEIQEVQIDQIAKRVRDRRSEVVVVEVQIGQVDQIADAGVKDGIGRAVRAGDPGSRKRNVDADHR